MEVGAGPAAQVGAALDQMDLEAALGQSAGGGHAADAAAQHGNLSARIGGRSVHRCFPIPPRRQTAPAGKGLCFIVSDLGGPNTVPPEILSSLDDGWKASGHRFRI
jgi:hypothetical protein